MQIRKGYDMLEKLKKHKLIIGIILLSVIYFILTSVQNPIFYYNAGYDDLYILISAMSILDIDWLGPFSGVTLTKGPGAPIFIAIANGLGLSLMQAQFLFYIGACILFVHTLKHVIKTDWVRLMIFAVILFNPVMYDVELLRVYRDNINSSLLLYVIACGFGIFFHYKEKPKKIVPYMIGFGVFATWMAITREEAIWIAPFTIGSSVITVFFILFDKECTEKMKKVLLYFIPIVIYCFTIAIICLLNKIAYGEFIRIENSSKPWKDFMKAVSSVDVEEPNILVPLSREAMEKLYEVSPSFAELREYFESEDGMGFADAGEVEDQIDAGWLSWAIISAVHGQGYDTDLKTMNNYYRRVTAEVNQAYEEGRLKKEDKPASIFEKQNLEKLFENLEKAFDLQVGMNNIALKIGEDTFYAENPDFPKEREDVFREITGNTSTNSKTYHYKMDEIKFNALTGITKVYETFSKPIFFIALAIYVFEIMRFFFIKPRFANYPQLIILTSLIMLHLIRLFVIAYTQTALCPAINVMYLSSTYSVQFAFEILSVIFGIEGLMNMLKYARGKNK